jgi:hypothetical protein
MAIRNAKTRKQNDPYEIWASDSGDWTWDVLKFYSNDLDDRYARVFCKVFSPFTPLGELGDVYYNEIKGQATRIYQSPDMVL